MTAAAQEHSIEAWLARAGALEIGLLAAACGLLIGAVARAASRSAPGAQEDDMAKGSVPAGVAAQYEGRYEVARIRPERAAQIDAEIDRILAARARYERVAAETGVPWHVIAVIHLLESNLSFAKHLHNGDPLTGRTVHVPADRPAAPPRSGSFPYTWEESAADALSRFRSWRNWGVAGTLYQLEKYNGWGYQNRGVPSPYLWSYSDQYERGKYASDGVYDPNLVSRQPGAASVLKRMEERRIISIPR